MNMGRRPGTSGKHYWKSGPDEIDHKLYMECQRARAQARFRGEEWVITEREYIQLWRTDDLYLRKGRSIDCYCLTRKDPELAWSLDNVQFVTRGYLYKMIGSMSGSGRCQARKLARQKRKELQND